MKRFIAMAVAAVIMASGFAVPVMGGSLPTPTPIPDPNANTGRIQVDFVRYGTRVEIVRLLDMTARVSPNDPMVFIRMAYTINEEFVDFFASRTYDGRPITTGRMAVAYINNLNELDRQDRQAGQPALAVRYSEFATAVREYVLTNRIEWNREGSPISYAYGVIRPPHTGAVIFDNLPLGHYVVFAGTQTSVHATLYSTTHAHCVVIKGDTVEVEKTVRIPTAGVNEIRIYDVTSNVPDVTGYDEFSWILHDEMTRGLTFNNDVRMTINNQDIPDAAFNVTVAPSSNPANVGGTAIQIQLTNALTLFAGFDPGDDIHIIYSTTINDYAVIGAPGNPNTVSIEYSHRRLGVMEYGRTIVDDKSTATIFTFDLQLLKVDQLDNTMTLENAVFSLYTTTHPIDGEGNPIPNVPTRNHEGTTLFLITNTLRSDANGVVRWIRDNNGVETDYDIKIGAGVFYLFETQAPMGYFLMDEPISFEVIAVVDGNTLESLSVVGGNFTYNATTGIISRTIENFGLDDGLPYTGGIGTTIFMTIGGVVILGSLAGLLISNKKKVRTQ